ncbi:general transcription factor II-I repeat domain-containing protein 2B-like [Schistocerca piceifrons]|uniref:general transcription factor II-I repeat domain-containing protein 2B-like n=1 Tax=Schistocerca piceifrons TaxID=274613 RepID=UPI001F5E887C|nr:general transcription factor II-I repeat domain-containing protein 2B-like [Schistocerca piceifrons]
MRFWEMKMRTENCYHFPTLPTHENVDYKRSPGNLQKVLIELQEDLSVKCKSEEINLVECYKTYLTEEKYLQLRSFARREICLFGSTYKCEQLFSLMKTNKCNICTRLTDNNPENTLRLSIGDINPDINNLVLKIQTRSSH